MKKFLFLTLFCISFLEIVFAKEIDTVWCTKNGGTLNYDVEINCVTNDINQISYEEKIYNALCIPYYSFVLNNKDLLFLKITNFKNNKAHLLIDEFSLIITKDELSKYI